MINGPTTVGDAAVAHTLRPETSLGPRMRLSRAVTTLGADDFAQVDDGGRNLEAENEDTPTVHVSRARRSGFGELVQEDTSTHDWLEGRSPGRYSVRIIDDATS